jgi:hypothetical protein
VLLYTPIVPGTTALATISGGPVFNAQGTNVINTLQVQNNYTQERTSAANCKTYVKPSNIIVSSGYTSTCVTSVPTAIQNITMPFPGETSAGKGVATVDGAPPPDGNGGKGTEPSAVTKGNGCKLVVFTPGTYTGQIKFTHTVTYYFESGLYYFTGGFSAFDDGNPTTDKLFVIGGQKSPGDKVTFATQSPCWNVIQSTYASKGGPGTGAEWILGTKTWMDVHTVNLELFTREGGQSWEGAQGLSIREVPPNCTAGKTPGKGPSCLDAARQAAKNPQGVTWKPSNPGGNPNQLFQVDAAEHLPQVFIHGGLFTPDNDIEEFTNAASVVLGPIDCNSLELSFKSRSSPPLSVEAGTGTPSVAIIATAKGKGHPYKAEAIYGQTATFPTKPVRLLYWWVLPTSRK